MAGFRRPEVWASAPTPDPPARSAEASPDAAANEDDEEDTAVADADAVGEWAESTFVEPEPEVAARALAQAAPKPSPPSAPRTDLPAGKSGRGPAAAPAAGAQRAASERPRGRTLPPPPPSRRGRPASIPPRPRPAAKADAAPGPPPGKEPRAASGAPVAAVAGQPTGPALRQTTAPPALPAAPRGQARLRSAPPAALDRDSLPASDAEDEESTMRPKRHRHDSFAEESSSTLDELTSDDFDDDLGMIATLDRGPRLPLGGGEERASLVIIAGNDRGRELELRGKTAIVGRGKECDLVLTDIAASRKHAELRFDGRLYQVRDLGSGNGTLINDAFHDDSFALRDGDRIELGNTVFRIDHPASRAGAAAAPPERPGAPLIEPDAMEAPAEIGRPAAASATAFEGDEESTADGDGPATTPEPAAARALAAARNRRGATSALNDVRASLPPIPPGASVEAERPADPASQPQLPPPPEPPPLPEYPQAPEGAAAWDALPSAEHLLRPRRRRRPAVIASSAIAAAAVVAVVAAFALRGEDAGTEFAAATPGVEEQKGDLGAGAQSAQEKEGDGDSESATATQRAPGGKDPAEEEIETFEGEVVKSPGDESEKQGELAAQEAAAAPPEAVERTMPASVWGTDERRLIAEAEALRRAQERAEEKDTEPEDDAERERAERERAERERARAQREQRARQQRQAQARAQRRNDGSAALREAEQYYRNRDFSRAVEILRTAAAQVGGDAARQLRGRASGYERLGRQYSQGQSARQSSPSASFVAFQEALRIDRQLGGAHAELLRAQIRVVAPRAAVSYMANGRYEAAKGAADAAARVGAESDPQVERVRRGLDRKAEQLFRRAHGMRGSDPEQAVRLLRRVQRMVPEGNPWRARAQHMLSARGEN